MPTEFAGNARCSEKDRVNLSYSPGLRGSLGLRGSGKRLNHRGAVRAHSNIPSSWLPTNIREYRGPCCHTIPYCTIPSFAMNIRLYHSMPHHIYIYNTKEVLFPGALKDGLEVRVPCETTPKTKAAFIVSAAADCENERRFSRTEIFLVTEASQKPGDAGAFQTWVPFVSPTIWGLCIWDAGQGP